MMIYKKFIDEHNLKDVPTNGIVMIETKNEKGELVNTRTGVSNIPELFENDEYLANLNGYYRYVEEEIPEYDEEQEYLTYEYVARDNAIVKVWNVNEIEEELTNVEHDDVNYEE